jgi:peptidoglycan/xylan/chitin deacetylase (PgdA/CDA1 family)
MTSGRALLYAATLAALALFVGVAFGRAVPLYVAAVALVVYLGIVVLGALWPRLEMFANVVWKGPEGSRGVALTFDDGPHPDHTAAVLDELKRHGARATFFVLGERAERCPELVRRIAHEGHTIGVHGYLHDRLLACRTPSTVRADLERALRIVEAITGDRPVLYRPPVGQTNPRIAKVARELGLAIVGWSVRGRDGVATPCEKVVRRITAGLGHGAIVLLHDAAERGCRIPTAPQALGPILDAMRQKSLDSVRVDEWLYGVSRLNPPA